MRDHEIDGLVVDYRAGSTVYQLAEKYQIHRTTVSVLLEKRGVDRRWRVLHPADVELAKAHYASGLSCATIGGILGVHPNTIHRVLTKAGVALRDPHGRLRPE